MKFSEIWLREWVNPSINNIELINQLTMIGFKVDEIKPISNNFYGIVIGKIIKCTIHPNFNNIWNVKVNNGEKKLLNIICSAANCRKNIKVVVAKVGAVLPNGNKITLNTIQGQISEGILCTFKTLGIFNNTQESIIEIPKDAKIGQNFYDYLRLYDKIIDINITPNRGDCLSIIGIAREIAAINHLKIKKFKKHTIKPLINDTISVIIKAPDACPKYLIRIIKNINISVPTPLWIKEKLRRCGICSINIVIDITNYVLIELGHPVHVFDYEKISGNIIKVYFTKHEEIINLSENNVLKLSPNTLIITDNKQILSLAGIIISDKCCTYSQTCSIILQSAFFTPSIIANQSTKYNIHTLSSIRYARGVDPNISQLALERVTSLLLKNCHGYPGPIINITHEHLLPKSIPITLHRTKLNKILGFHIKTQEIKNILKSLGFKIKLLSNNSWTILHPTWRFDISIEENIIAEIIRIYGYDKIPDITVNTNLIIPNNTTSVISLSKIKSLLIARGYQEIITYSFVNPNIQKLLYPKKNPLNLKNPITTKMSSMRLSLWIGLIETMIYNQNRQQKNIKLFESGICFIPNNTTNNNQINQNFMIAGIRSGLRFNEHWDLKKYPVDFYDIKGDVEALLHLTNKFNYIKFEQSKHPALHPIQNAAIYLNNKICIGYIGLIHPIIQTTLKIRSHILVFELKWDLISQYILPNISTISKFPKNDRDISIIISDKISSESIINTCKKIASDQLIDLKLSDVYKDSSIPKNCKSLTIKLSLQSKTHTLTEEEISNIIDQCIQNLKKSFYITLR